MMDDGKWMMDSRTQNEVFDLWSSPVFQYSNIPLFHSSTIPLFQCVLK
jgi:hypothetical protein